MGVPPPIPPGAGAAAVALGLISATKFVALLIAAGAVRNSDGCCRSSTASRSLHGFGLLSVHSLHVLCITSSVYRVFEIIFPKISFFRVRYKF